ncbi:hypothetical protein [Micromonospora craniellae]|uniref:Uncharacterized protein n=1 Tax=Micromonospora craniellae TaxID=2294034 RepID=A0A372FTM6_9ACTN|nr:hypothetical protein [Micromonospora craniellae]QOC92349.1 hypothetical protein ID554_00650 [Micromonospora craniellae]RFS44101.1 hypothetical protein D0Q02_23865 [Micromonospora craniellae]
MSKPLRPRRTTINGEDLVVLPVADYERLATARRQLGAREARLRGLTDQVRALTELLAAIQQVLAEAPACCDTRRDVDSHINDLMCARRLPRPASAPETRP